MARISELLIANPKMTRFEELEAAVIEAAQAGEIHLYMDIKPEFPDTPRNWERSSKWRSIAPSRLRRDGSVKTRLKTIARPTGAR